MKHLLIILIPLSCYSQITDYSISLHWNTRNAKIDTVFDWWVGMSGSVTFDSVLTLKGGASTERDNGIQYYAYESHIVSKYAKTGLQKDTEKDIQFYYISLFYPVKIFKFGVEFLETNEHEKLSVYIGIKRKWVECNFSAVDRVTKFDYMVNPQIKIKRSNPTSLEHQQR